MGGGRVRHFVRDRAELAAWLLRAKLTPCPHCRTVGALNRHGPITGYAQHGSERVVRGHRLFCSNRGRRPGCGRTVAVVFADALHTRTVRTGTLWRFLLGVAAGLPRKVAWETTGLHVLCLRSGYRLFHRFARAGPAIRTRLLSLRPPPRSTSPSPLAQLTEHLKLALPEDNPLATFQHRFQVDLIR